MPSPLLCFFHTWYLIINCAVCLGSTKAASNLQLRFSSVNILLFFPFNLSLCALLKRKGEKDVGVSRAVLNCLGSGCYGWWQSDSVWGRGGRGAEHQPSSWCLPLNAFSILLNSDDSSDLLLGPQGVYSVKYKFPCLLEYVSTDAWPLLWLSSSALFQRIIWSYRKLKSLPSPSGCQPTFILLAAFPVLSLRWLF